MKNETKRLLEEFREEEKVLFDSDGVRTSEPIGNYQAATMRLLINELEAEVKANDSAFRNMKSRKAQRDFFEIGRAHV